MVALPSDEWIKMKLEALSRMSNMTMYLNASEQDFIIIKLKEISTLFDEAYERHKSERPEPGRKHEGDVVMAYSKEPKPECGFIMTSPREPEPRVDKKQYEYIMKSAKYHYQKKHYAEAITKFTEAISLAVDEASRVYAKYMIAYSYFWLGMYKDAHNYISDAVAAEPGSTAYQQLKDKIEFNIRNKR